MMRVEINGNPDRVVSLHKSTYLVGRSSVCNLRLQDSSLQLVHARLNLKDGILTLAPHDDADVLVNGEPLHGEVRIGDGDRIGLGQSWLRIKDTRQQRADETAGHTEAEWTLHGLSPGLHSKCYAISGSLVIGRSQDCDLRLGDVHLSRRHARLRPTRDGLIVDDLDSANGTYVNGRRVTKALLKNGDELSLDTVKFRVFHSAACGEDDETILQQPVQDPSRQRALEGAGGGAQPPRRERPEPAKPKGPTAIEIQRAALKRQRDQGGTFPGGGPSSAADRQAAAGRGQTGQGGWLALTTMVVAVAGALWGASSFLGPALLN